MLSGDSGQCTARSSEDRVVRFVDVAGQAGLDRRGQAGGAIVDDFDNDGLLDVVISSVNDCESLHYYHNNGDGTFTDRTAAGRTVTPNRRTQYHSDRL